MKWEDLTVYKILSKEELSIAKKEIENIIFKNLQPYGFKKSGRKLIRKSEDLFHIIHLDTRGSWMGASKSLNTEISLVSVYDTEVFLDNYELTGRKYIQDLIPKIKNYYQITQEYQLFADFISRKLIKYAIPYFDRFKNSKDILSNSRIFKTDYTSEILERNQNLILYCELTNHINKNSSQILNDKIESMEKAKNYSSKFHETKSIKEIIEKKDWLEIDKILKTKENLVLRKLKII